MKSFLENRHAITPNATGVAGVVSKGSGFQKLGTSIATPPKSSFPLQATTEQVANPNGPDAPQVEFIRNGDTIVKILVSFGEQKVEIDCQY